MRSAVRFILGDWDPRTPQEVDREVQDELSFHLEMIEAELREQGMNADAAASEARRRFGDVERYRRECRDVALKERIMIQRINLFLLVIVAAALGVSAWQSWAGQQRTAQAVDAMNQRLEAVAAKLGQSSAPDAARVAASNPSTKDNVVWLAGDVERPGAYAMPDGPFTLRRLLVAAGWGPKNPADVIIMSRGADGSQATEECSWEELQVLKGKDPILKGSEIVTLKRRAAESGKIGGAVDRAPVKPDAHGRLKAHQFDKRAIDNVDSLATEAVIEFERLAEELNFSAIEAHARLVLVVGDVIRPGLYDLNAISAEGLPAGAAILRQAGTTVEPKAIAFISRTETKAMTPKLTWKPPVALYSPGTSHASLGGYVMVVTSASTNSRGQPLFVKEEVLVPTASGWAPLEQLMTVEAGIEYGKWIESKMVFGPGVRNMWSEFPVRPPNSPKAIDFEAGSQRARFLPAFQGREAKALSLNEVIPADLLRQWAATGGGRPARVLCEVLTFDESGGIKAKETVDFDDTDGRSRIVVQPGQVVRVRFDQGSAVGPGKRATQP